MKGLGPRSCTSEIKEVMLRPRFVWKGLSGHKVSGRVSPTGHCWVHLMGFQESNTRSGGQKDSHIK